MLPENERGAAGRAALLRVGVGEQRPFLRHAIDVGRLVAHHAEVVGADVVSADVVAPDDEDVGLSCPPPAPERRRISAPPQRRAQPAVTKKFVSCHGLFPLVSLPRPACSALLLEREDPFPVVLHADDCPALFLRLVVQRLGEGADPGIGEPLGWAIRILALRVVMQHDH